MNSQQTSSRQSGAIVRRAKPQPSSVEGGERGLSVIKMEKHVRGKCPQDIRPGDKHNALRNGLISRR